MEEYQTLTIFYMSEGHTFNFESQFPNRKCVCIKLLVMSISKSLHQFIVRPSCTGGKLHTTEWPEQYQIVTKTQSKGNKTHTNYNKSRRFCECAARSSNSPSTFRVKCHHLNIKTIWSVNMRTDDSNRQIQFIRWNLWLYFYCVWKAELKNVHTQDNKNVTQ